MVTPIQTLMTYLESWRMMKKETWRMILGPRGKHQNKLQNDGSLDRGQRDRVPHSTSGGGDDDTSNDNKKELVVEPHQAPDAESVPRDVLGDEHQSSPGDAPDHQRRAERQRDAGEVPGDEPESTLPIPGAPHNTI